MPARRAGLLELPDFRFGHAERFEPPARGAGQRLIGRIRLRHAPREQVFLLRRKQIGGIDLGQHLPGAHRIVHRAHVQLLDPSRGAHLGARDAPLVGLHRADRRQFLRGSRSLRPRRCACRGSAARARSP